MRNVTINLKVDKSLPDKIGHLTSTNFFDYFSVKYLLTKHKLCAIPYWLNWIVYSKSEQAIEIPEYFIDKCVKSKRRFISVPLCLESDIGGSHANALFIDTKEKTVERWEPHGARSYVIFKDYEYEKFDKQLNDFFKKRYGYKYIPSSNFLPALGPQTLENYINESGYCATWSLWYIDMRLTYPNIPREELVVEMFEKVQQLLSESKKQLSQYLVNYAKQVYRLMIIEFPHYKDFFINFNTYNRLPKRSAKGLKFQKFLNEMENLMKDEIHINRRVSIKKEKRDRTFSVYKNRSFTVDPKRTMVKMY